MGVGLRLGVPVPLCDSDWVTLKVEVHEDDRVQVHVLVHDVDRLFVCDPEPVPNPEQDWLKLSDQLPVDEDDLLLSEPDRLPKLAERVHVHVAVWLTTGVNDRVFVPDAEPDTVGDLLALSERLPDSVEVADEHDGVTVPDTDGGETVAVQVDETEVPVDDQEVDWLRLQVIDEVPAALRLMLEVGDQEFVEADAVRPVKVHDPVLLSVRV